MQVGCLAAGIEAHAAVSSRKVTEAKVALESELAKLVTEKAEVFKASKALNSAMAIIHQKEGELNATRTTLAAAQTVALADVVASQAAIDAEVAAVRVATDEEVAATWTETEKAIEDKFGADFF